MRACTIRPSSLALAAALSLTATAAAADYYRWSAAIEDDPFAETPRMIMDFTDTPESGLALMCDKASNTLTIRLGTSLDVTGVHLPTYDLMTRLKVDDFAVFIEGARAIMLMNGNLAAEFDLEGDDSKRLLEELKAARSTLYLNIEDFIDTMRFPVNGSTAAARKMADFCLSAEPEPAPTETTKNRPARKLSIDWKAYAASRDAGAWDEREPEDRPQAIETFALATAYAHHCADLTVNSALMRSMADGMGISLTEGTADESEIEAITAKKIDAYAEDSPEQICEWAESAFGPEGKRVRNLMRAATP